jgi:hypothetical protein
MHPHKQFEPVFCRWHCPLCGVSKLCVRSHSDCESTANNLRTHIRATNDAAHSSVGEFPPEIDPHELDAYVSCRQ